MPAPDGARRRVMMALMFFPRGGSSHVTRSLARFLPAAGWDVTLVSGSRGQIGEGTHASTFFAGLDVHVLDYNAALAAPDPFAAEPPLHPSFEDRPGAPDRVFAAVDDKDFAHLVATWERALTAAGAADADVLHLNHLTPINEAAARTCPEVPVVGHVHGTELLMLEQIERGALPGWSHAQEWRDRLRRWAHSCARLLALSPGVAERAKHLLGVDSKRIVLAPNGFDPNAFERRPLRGAERVQFWRRWLVDEPRGWDESGEPGSVRYAAADLEAFADDAPVLIYVGRFTEVKRLSLLVRAYARARPQFGRRAPLVLLGGHPGEWEGEHPQAVVRAQGVEDIFLPGWHGHDELPDFLNASDVCVLASVREGFGQVLVEAGACGLSAVAVNAGGPATIVADGESGWLVPPDDESALADALVAAVNDDGERVRRGEAAHTLAHERYSWPALARGVARVYEGVQEEPV
jgi:glycosyltransferase involved in cell wall biosynthesis